MITTLQDIAITVMVVAIFGTAFLFILSMVIENFVSIIFRFKREFDEDNKRGNELVDIDKIRTKLHKRVHHMTPWDKHVSILEERGTGYSVLLWKYSNHKVEARSKDYELLSCLRDCIEMYLEETEEVKE